MQLILSLFPGIGLLDMAFEEAFEGEACIVRGPDLLWGGNVKAFHPPTGKFDGIIGGPPCKAHSSMAAIVRARYGDDAVAEDLIPEFERCVAEAQPTWFLMENTPRAPRPCVDGYAVSSVLLNNRSFGSAQNRVRRFSFGIHGETPVSLLPFIDGIEALENPCFEYAVMAGHQGAGASIRFSGKRKDGTPYTRTAGTLKKYNRIMKRTLAEEIELQGLPGDLLDHAPFTHNGKREVIGNGVPLPMGRAVARAVRQAIG